MKTNYKFIDEPIFIKKLKLKKHKTLDLANAVKNYCIIDYSYIDKSLLTKYQDNKHLLGQVFELDLNRRQLTISTDTSTVKSMKQFFNKVIDVLIPENDLKYNSFIANDVIDFNYEQLIKIKELIKE